MANLIQILQDVIQALGQIDWKEVVVGILAILGIFSAIAKITPTEADNKFIDKIVAFIHKLGLTK